MTAAARESDRVWIVGELNPYGSDPQFALYPSPPGCSGHRLWQILGVTEDRYLAFRRTNLCAGTWSAREASAAARGVLDEVRVVPPGVRPLVVLCGTKVSAAFGTVTVADRGARRATPLRAWETGDDAWGAAAWLSLPHPSGLCRLWTAGGVGGMWNPGGTVDRARALLRASAPHVPWGELFSTGGATPPASLVEAGGRGGRA